MNKVFTDGAASGNPGPGGWGFLAHDSESGRVLELGSFVPNSTNNQMEMRAAIEALVFFRKQKVQNELYIYSDSEYVIKGITQWIFGWKKRQWSKSDGSAVANKDLWIELDEARARLPVKVHWVYVPGHAGVMGNERVDEIAVCFSKEKDPRLYDGSFEDYGRKECFEAVGNRVEVSRYKKPKYLSLVDGVFALYDTWPDCQAAVKGKKGAKFKKVMSSEEEQMLRNLWTGKV